MNCYLFRARRSEALEVLASNWRRIPCQSLSQSYTCLRRLAEHPRHDGQGRSLQETKRYDLEACSLHRSSKALSVVSIMWFLAFLPGANHVKGFRQIIHDFEHGGLNNDFLIKSSDMLALRYNDRSPLENHHLAAAFYVLRHPECFFLNKMNAGQVSNLRHLCIDMVLATDMKQHFSILSQFQVSQPSLLLLLWRSVAAHGPPKSNDAVLWKSRLSLASQASIIVLCTLENDSTEQTRKAFNPLVHSSADWCILAWWQAKLCQYAEGSNSSVQDVGNAEMDEAQWSLTLQASKAYLLNHIVKHLVHPCVSILLQLIVQEF